MAPPSSTTGPGYYRRGSIQTWDFIRDQGLNFHLGNAIKYICRAGYKDNKIQDLSKAIHYLQNELENTIEDITETSERVQESVSDWEYKQQEGQRPAKEFDR